MSFSFTCISLHIIFEPSNEKTNKLGFRSGPTQTGLHSHRNDLEACIYGSSKKRGCTIPVAKTKALITV